MQRQQLGVLVLTSVAVLVTACSQVGQRVPIDADLLDESRTAKKAPAEIQPQAGQQACGEVLLQQGQERPAAARECFEASIGTRAARLVVAMPTDEGDPIVYYYLTTADLKGYDLIIDQTRDRYSSGGWTRQRCQPAGTIDGSSAACSAS